MPAFAALVAVAVLLGFGRTFFLPLAQGRFSAPWFVYVHAALFLIWVTLFGTQVTLAAKRRMQWHRRLGWSAVAIVPMMTASGVVVAVWATHRDLSRGQTGALAFFCGLLMDMLLFFAFASVALVMRRRPAVHKRLMVFATVAVLGAAIGRIPVVGDAANAIAVGLVLAVAAFDVTIDGRLQAVTVVGGAILLAGIFSETPLGQTETWARVGPSVLSRLTP